MKTILLTGFFLWITVTGFAQDDNGKVGGRLEAYKIAFLTKKLNLNVEEAQKFWPVYNKYFDDIRQVKRQNRNLGEIEQEQKIIDIRKKYKNEFEQILSADRANQFFKADKEFNNILLKELQERREANQERRAGKQDN